mmetsp:Transcript_37648/g.93476  ORF Transcript_37648/g.93476 Transcript_37648/m.93476 type:complete len:248 (-) Transcript_37648:898-1641(-)
MEVFLFNTCFRTLGLAVGAAGCAAAAGRHGARSGAHGARRQRLIGAAAADGHEREEGEEAVDTFPPNQTLEALREGDGGERGRAEGREEHRVDGRALLRPEGVRARRGEHREVAAHAREQGAGHREEDGLARLHDGRRVEEARKRLRQGEHREGGAEAELVREGCPPHAPQAVAHCREPAREREEAVISKMRRVEGERLKDRRGGQPGGCGQQDERPEEPECRRGDGLLEGAIDRHDHAALLARRGE